MQHWVERLCQTRLEQITCVENESSEVQVKSPPPPTSPRAAVSLRRVKAHTSAKLCILGRFLALMGVALPFNGRV